MVEQGKKPLPLSVIIWGMIAILLVAGLLLPPISLGERLFGTDYVRLDADNSRADHPDGLTLVVDTTMSSDRLQVKLDSIPQLDVSSGAVTEEWQAAAAALPADLVLKSPLYGIAFKDDVDPPVQLDIAIPNNAEPYSLLDLYVWNGTEWYWIPSQLDTATDTIHVALDRAPKAVAVLQAEPKTPAVEVLLGDGVSLPFKLSTMVTGVHPVGLILGPGGAVMGDIAHLGGGASAYQQVPVVSSADPVMVQALLADPAAVSAHVAALADVAAGGSYAGLHLDYPGVPTPQQDAFTNLITGVAAELHAAGLELYVTVPAPTQDASGAWDTAGYDWFNLLNTADADRLVLSLPLDPYFYADIKLAESMLTWAVSQVDRYQLLLGVNAAGVQLINGEYSPVDPADALAALNTLLARADGGESEMLPGQEVVVGFPAKTLTFDPDATAYRVSYDVEGQEINTWLSSAVLLDHKLALVKGFRLGGTLISGMSEAQLDDEVLPALDAFLTAAAAPMEQAASLAWFVQDESGAALVQQPGDLGIPQYAWEAVETPGAYSIGGSFNVGSHVADLGAVQVAVVVEEATPTPSPEPTGTPEPTATPTPEVGSGGSSGTVASDADAVIAGSIVNVREGPDTAFRQLTSLSSGTELEILAVNPAKTWLKISASDGTEGWVYAPLCTVNISLDGLPEEDVPTPTPAPTTEGSVAPPVAPPPVSSGGFELGGHIRTWNYLGQMGSAGMNWVKVQVHYGQDASGLVELCTLKWLQDPAQRPGLSGHGQPG